MRFDDRSADRKSHAKSVGLGREERFKDALRCGRIKPRAGVLDRNLDTVRFGQGLQSDFGAPRVRPGLTGTDAYMATLPFAWYVFAGLDGQAVAWDETLDGLPFASSQT